MNENEAFFTVDTSDIEVTYVGEYESEDMIAAYAGVKVNAKLGENLIKVYIPATAMDLLCTTWTSTDGNQIVDLIID